MKWKLLWYIGVYLGIIENNMETTMVCWGLYRDNGKSNGNCYGILGFI